MLFLRYLTDTDTSAHNPIRHEAMLIEYEANGVKLNQPQQHKSKSSEVQSVSQWDSPANSAQEAVARYRDYAILHHALFAVLVVRWLTAFSHSRAVRPQSTTAVAPIRFQFWKAEQ